MRKETRIVFNGFLGQVAKLNGVSSAEQKFNVTPAVQQKLETAIQESNALLQKVNVITVTEQEGESILLGVNGPIASRTNTKGGNRRNPLDRSLLTKDSYSCKQTNFDSAFPYQLIDAWARFPDFQVRLSKAITERQALDRIMIGFNGKSAEAATDLGKNPLLQDVNKGWLQKIREGAADRVLEEGAEGSGKIKVGSTGDYKTLDGLVYDLVQMLEPWHRSRPDLVVLISRDLMHNKLLAAVEKGGASNVEANAADQIVAKARLGGLPVVDAPFFPEGTILVTTLVNLSIYVQEGGRRRYLKDEPEYDRIADYQSSNDAYVIEDFGLVALAEHVEAV
ncbi:phage major capsid protein, P2 family [Pseudomonas asuensis]|uniref:Phage major capsid protein, P2 family n=1 Tax=Pseudomonas asuensis TaxID=1825787 RepID=A0ABQ2H453_9PSED|nr:phage major capsid protein, P2 family [Pseudomonas asuensis]GGM30397.1 phage major capsid protein, P2 family [Pseudomonas asuensis]